MASRKSSDKWGCSLLGMSSYLLARVQRDHKEKQVKGGCSNHPIPANKPATMLGGWTA
jgi:hypothetical protein